MVEVQKLKLSGYSVWPRSSLQAKVSILQLLAAYALPT